MELDGIRIQVASPQQVHSWSSGAVTLPETLDWNTMQPVPGGLFCSAIFSDPDRMGHIELVEPVDNIWLYKTLTRLLGLPAKRVRRLFDGFDDEAPHLHALPVLPTRLRPIERNEDGLVRNSHLNELYRRVLSRNSRLRKLLEVHAPHDVLDHERELLQLSVDALLDRVSGLPAFKDPKTGRRFTSLADHLTRRLREAILNASLAEKVASPSLGAAAEPAAPEVDSPGAAVSSDSASSEDTASAEAAPITEGLRQDILAYFRGAALDLDAEAQARLAPRLLRRTKIVTSDEDEIA